MGDPKTAAVILNHSDDKNAGNLVRFLQRGREADRILLADNSETGPKPALEALQDDDTDVIYLQNRGYARGNNEALIRLRREYGFYDYVAVMNPDIEIGAGEIRKCVEFLDSHADYAAAAPRMFDTNGAPHHLSGWKERTFLCDLAYSSGLLSRIIGMYRETYPPEHWQEDFCDVDCLAGSFFVIKNSVFESVGKFDENTFLYFEEDILGSKLRRAGYKLAVLNKEKFVHFEGGGLPQKSMPLKKYLAMQKSRIYFQKQYKQIGTAQTALLWAATGLGAAEKIVKSAFAAAKRRGKDEPKT